MSSLAAAHRRHRVATGVRWTLLALFSLPWVVLPLWMLLVNSFKTEGQASIPSLSLPTHWNILHNYRAVIDQGGYFGGLGNSALMAIPTILVVVLFGSMAAWIYARSPSRSLKFAYYATSVSMILPPAIIPTVYMLTQMGINGSREGYFLTLVASRMGLVVFLTTGFINTLPASLEEAAELDGAGRWRIYWSIILPLVRPVLFSAAILLCISIWNDFLYALFLLSSQSEATLPLRLWTFASTSTNGIAWNLAFADVVLTGLPMLITYMVLQRRVLSGLTEGAVTG